MTDSINARESVEALETFDASARNARESIEALWAIQVDAVDARLSIEVLEQVFPSGTWGFIPIN